VTINVCMVGYGMMGVWHSDALKEADCCLHTAVGRREEAVQAFAAKYGYRRWTTRLDEALADAEIDVVILATPSEQHAEAAIASLQAGKHTLVEIPIAMNLADAEQVVATAAASGRTLGMVHQMRTRPVMRGIKERALAGEEHVRQVCGRFYIHRLQNVGATGYQRSWTDNILWHHTTHLLDVGLWLLGEPVRKVHSFMPPLDPKTGIPMEIFLGLETEKDQSLICTGSYYGRERMFEVLVVTDRDSYRLDGFRYTLTTGDGIQNVATEAETCGLVSRDFIDAVREGREPAVPGYSVLPTMRVLQAAQDEWDRRHGTQSIPGRPLRVRTAS
jgi:2-hydroxy-4-carboxymuconate semialdehyde hemiacetal dehydrogenase